MRRPTASVQRPYSMQSNLRDLANWMAAVAGWYPMETAAATNSFLVLSAFRAATYRRNWLVFLKESRSSLAKAKSAARVLVFVIFGLLLVCLHYQEMASFRKSNSTSKP